MSERDEELKPLSKTESTKLDAILALVQDDPEHEITITARTLCAVLEHFRGPVPREDQDEAHRLLAEAGIEPRSTVEACRTRDIPGRIERLIKSRAAIERQLETLRDE